MRFDDYYREPTARNAYRRGMDPPWHQDNVVNPWVALGCILLLMVLGGVIGWGMTKLWWCG